jgi:hypothetical protein
LVFFQFVLKQFYSVVSLLYRNREFRLNQNKQNTHPNSLKESIFGNFSKILGCFGLFRFVTKQICLFHLFRYRFETPKLTKIFSFWFHETNRNKPKQTQNRSCFGLFRLQPKIIFVCFEDTLVLWHYATYIISQPPQWLHWLHSQVGPQVGSHPLSPLFCTG